MTEWNKEINWFYYEIFYNWFKNVSGTEKKTKVASPGHYRNLDLA
jgi:hypothetical protein